MKFKVTVTETRTFNIDTEKYDSEIPKYDVNELLSDLKTIEDWEHYYYSLDSEDTIFIEYGEKWNQNIKVERTD